MFWAYKYFYSSYNCSEGLGLFELPYGLTEKLFNLAFMYPPPTVDIHSSNSSLANPPPKSSIVNVQNHTDLSHYIVLLQKSYSNSTIKCVTKP